MTYLEDFLKNLHGRHNVLIYCSSAWALFTDSNTKPIMINDTLGNHYVDNWLSAIASDTSLQKKFIIGSTVAKNLVTTEIYILNKGDDPLAQRLSYKANNIAVATSLLFSDL